MKNLLIELDEAELRLLEAIQGQLDEMKENSVSPEWVKEVAGYVERVRRLEEVLVGRLLVKVEEVLRPQAERVLAEQFELKLEGVD